MKVKFILCALLSFSALFSIAQNWSLKLSSNVEIRKWTLTSTYEKEEKALNGATIILSQDGKPVIQTTSDSNGDFTVMVPPNGEFLLTVSYPGYNTKRFTVNTKDVPPEFAKDDWKPSFSIGGFIMAKPFPGIDYSNLQKPLVLVSFIQKKKVFDHDEVITNTGLNVIVAKIFEDEDDLIKRFCNTNKQGDAALAKPDCPLAKQLYEKAISIIPGEQYPVEQLKKVGLCLKDKEAAEKKAAEEAANKTNAEKAAAEKAAADKIAAEKKAADDKVAKEKAAQDQAAQDKLVKEKAAQEQAAGEKAAKQKAENDRIAAEKEAVEKAAADKLAKEKAAADKEAKRKEGAAKAKAEDEAEAKAIAEKNKQKEADKEAKRKEGLAKAKAEDEAEAKAIEDKRRKRQAEEDEAKKLAYETKGGGEDGEMGKGNSKTSIPQTVIGADKYKTTIKKADDFFKMKRWAEAKTAYEEALTYKTDDVYAKSKLETVNKNLTPPK